MSGGRVEGRARKIDRPGWRLSRGLCFKRDPPEEPPSEERYGAEGMSPGSRVIAAVPAFPSLVLKLSDTKWNHHSPLTGAGAAPDSALKGTTGFHLSPAVIPEAGNLDRLLQHHCETAVNNNIKISSYGDVVRIIKVIGLGLERAASSISTRRTCRPFNGHEPRPASFGRYPGRRFMPARAAETTG